MVMNKKKMLITGVSGLLGSNLALYFRDKYEILGLYLAHPVSISGIGTERCDLSLSGPIKKIVRDFHPCVIIHCASLTSVDQCEIDMDLAWEMNVLSTRNLMDCIMEKDVKPVYISTDAVYDGSTGDFSEHDKVNPLNCYGRTKREGETEILKKDNALVLRTNIFGWNIQDKKSLGEWVLEELQAKRPISGFTDACFSSIYTMELARVIDMAIRKDIKGIFNCGSPESCSKYEFASRIADVFGLDKTFITPISIDDFDFKAKRGKNLTLCLDKIQNALDYKLPTIEGSIEAFYKDYKCGLPDSLKQDPSAVVREESGSMPYGMHWIDENDIQAVVQVLRSDRITQGPKVEQFERALADYTGSRYAVAVNSGTAALHIACLAAGIEPGDEIITSPITFVASANCAVYCGAKPVFGDIDSKTYNLSPEEIEKKITLRTRMIIPVHFAGQSCDMGSIEAIVREKEKKLARKIYILEDACHALGSLYKDKRAGSCSFSDMTAFSFHPVKHITTGEGGAVLTNDATLYKKLKRFRSHGITNMPDEFVYDGAGLKSSRLDDQCRAKPWYYEQIDLGYNYRITDIQCALGLSQLKRLENFRERRRQIVNIYNKSFDAIESIQIPFESNECESNFHLYVLVLDFEHIGVARSQFMVELKRRGIQTQVHYIPVHTHPFYRRRYGMHWGDYPIAEQYYQRCLSLPLFAAMTDEDAEKVISEILDIVKNGLPEAKNGMT